MTALGGQMKAGYNDNILYYVSSLFRREIRLLLDVLACDCTRDGLYKRVLFCVVHWWERSENFTFSSIVLTL